jgi:O-antigen ligase
MTAMLLPYTWWFIQWRLAHRPNAYSSRPRIDQALLIGRFFFFVALGGILASASRSGIFIGLPLVFAYILTERKINPAGQWSDDWDEVQEMEKSRGRSFIRLSPLILKVLTIAGGVVLIIPLLLMARGGASGWLTHERFDYWVTGLAIFADNPIWGIGQGGSRQMLNIYTERVAPSEIIHFHNDYLQFLVEWGLVMSVIIGGLAVSAILKTRHDWKKQKVSSRNVVIALRRAAAWSIAIALAAAFVDFHLRIFYVATIFAGSVTIWIAGGWRYFAKN